MTRAKRIPFLTKPALVCVLLLGVAALGGCDTLAFVGRNVGDSRKYKVNPKYRGLQNQKVGVLVSSSNAMRFRFPDAAENTTRVVTVRLAEHVPGIELVDPDQMAHFRTTHRYWTTMPYAELVKKLEVDRLVVIDLNEYRTHKPGNRNLWRGVMAGSIGVVANPGSPPRPVARGQGSDSDTHPDNASGSEARPGPSSSDPEIVENPNDFVFYDTIGVRFPPDGKVGLLDSDNQTIQLGMLTMFARDVTRLFYQHKVSGGELRRRARRSASGT